MIAIVLTTTLVVGSLRSRPGSQEVIPAIAPPTAPPHTPAAPTSTVGGQRPVGDANLLGDPGFEARLAGWRPIGRWAVSLAATGAAD